MTGQEMLIRNVLKMLGVSPESIEGTFQGLKNMELYAMSVSERLTEIERKQNRILELLEARVSPEFPQSAIAAPATLED